MQIQEEVKIQDVFRQGKRGHRDCNVIVKLCFHSDKVMIFSHASNLKGKRNARKKLYYINDDLMEQQAETKRYVRDLQFENKSTLDESERRQIRIQRGKIMCNNHMIQQKIKNPTAAQTLKLSNQQIEDVMTVKIVEGADYEENGSEFLSFSHKARTIDDVNKGFQKMRIKYADATHISCAYRL